MATSDTNQATLRYAAETVWGESPGGKAATEVRLTSESLAHRKQAVVSQEVRADRQRADVLEVGQSADGDINFELSWKDFEPFFEGALFGAIASTTVAHASTVFAASTITGGLGVNYTAFKDGQWIRVKAAGNPNDGAVAQVASRSSTVITITGTTLTAGTASANINGRNLRNGTTEKSFFLEADFKDIAAVKYFTGMEVAQAQLNVQSNQIVGGVFSFTGKQGATASTSVASTLVASAGANMPMTAAANVGDLRESGASLATNVNAITLSVQNNLRQQPAVGAKPAIGVGAGGVDVTGTLNAYFEDITLYDKFITHSESDLSFRFTDANSNVIVVTLPSIYYSAGDPQITGQDADVFLPLSWTARRDPTQGYTLQLDFLPA